MASGQKKTQRPPPETILRLWDLEQPVADLIGKGKHVRSVPVPAWVKNAIDDCVTALARRMELSSGASRQTCGDQRPRSPRLAACVRFS